MWEPDYFWSNVINISIYRISAIDFVYKQTHDITSHTLFSHSPHSSTYLSCLFFLLSRFFFSSLSPLLFCILWCNWVLGIIYFLFGGHILKCEVSLNKTCQQKKTHGQTPLCHWIHPKELILPDWGYSWWLPWGSCWTCYLPQVWGRRQEHTQ